MQYHLRSANELNITIQIFNKAIELSPDSGHEKYMYMGQIHTGADAVTYFMKGIELMKKYMVDMAAQV